MTSVKETNRVYTAFRNQEKKYSDENRGLLPVALILYTGANF